MLRNGSKCSNSADLWLNFVALGTRPLILRVVSPSVEFVSVGELGRFIRASILNPLLAYARLAPFKWLIQEFRTSKVRLVLQRDPDNQLPHDATLESLRLTRDDLFLALVDVRSVAMALRHREAAIGTITLRWQEVPRDLDLHLLISTPDGLQRIWFREMGSLDSNPWAQLDQDVRTGLGPETIHIGFRSHSIYVVVVHNYSHEIPLTESFAEIVVSIGRESRSIMCPTVGKGEWWHVLELNAETGNIRLINQIGAEPTGFHF